MAIKVQISQRRRVIWLYLLLLLIFGSTGSVLNIQAASDHGRANSTTVPKTSTPLTVNSTKTITNVIKDYTRFATSHKETNCTIIDCKQDMNSSSGVNRQVWIQITTHWPVHTRLQQFDEILRTVKAEDGLLVIDVFAYNSDTGRLVYKIHMRNEGTRVVDCSVVTDKFLYPYMSLDKHCPTTDESD